MFRADIERRPKGVFVVKLKGRLNSDNYTAFEKNLKPILVPITKSLILDMSGLQYISSSGLGTIFGAKKYIELSGGTFIITNLQPQIKKVFDIVKALPVQSIFENMEEVDKYLDTMQQKAKEDEKEHL